MARRIVAFFNLLHIALLTLAKFMMVAMVLVVFVNVVLRYGFNSGLMWSEEVALLLAVWFGFISLALGVKQNLHINLTLISEHRMSDRANRVLDILRGIVYLAIGLAMLVFGWKLSKMTMGSIMPATLWPAGILYAVLPLSGFVVIYEAAADLAGIDTRDAAVDKYLSGEGTLRDATGGPDA